MVFAIFFAIVFFTFKQCCEPEEQFGRPDARRQRPSHSGIMTGEGNVHISVNAYK
jgi:hypothetical protein